jgi:hypothetical protein
MNWKIAMVSYLPRILGISETMKKTNLREMEVEKCCRIL